MARFDPELNKVIRTEKHTTKIHTEVPCLFCIEKQGPTPIFSEIPKLIRHVSAVHYDHPLYRKYFLGLKRIQVVIDYYTPKTRRKNIV